MVRSKNHNAGEELGEHTLIRLLMFTASSTRALDVTCLTYSHYCALK